ncbi:MAG TPA: ABC transporter permease subunit [Microlunatus sp.]|nr:ABC transporter permease subunit [Microlunatus sp.]
MRAGLAERILAPVITGLVLLAVFQLVASAGLISPSFSSPAAIALAGARAVITVEFWSALGVTLSAWLIAVVIAVLLGAVLGVIIGSVPVLRELTRPVIELLRPIPSVALIPLVVLTIGTQSPSGIFLAVFAAFWQVLVSAIDGARSVDSVARDTALTYRFSPLQRFWWVQLPTAMPSLTTGLRLATSTALILVVTAEIIIGVPGLGQQISLSRSGAAPDRMYASILVIGLLGLALNLLVAGIERLLLRNHPRSRTGGRR